MPPLPAAWAGFALAVVASAALTALWIAVARRRRWLDLPGARRLHGMPTPRGGGIGIALVMAVALLIADSPWLAAGVALFALVGLLDDLFPLHAAVKLALQLLAGTLLAISVPAPWLATAALAVAAAYTVNVFNFMDGSNGLLAAQGLVLGTAIALWPGQDTSVAVLAWCLAGACLGFLPFNVPVARIFLGDVGSHAIGAGVVALGLASVRRGTMPLAALLLALSPILLDTGLTLARRLLRGKPVWRAHREHLYQYAVRSGHGHVAVCLAYAGWTSACVLMAVAAAKLRSEMVMWILLILNGVVGAVATWWLRRQWLDGRRRGVA